MNQARKRTGTKKVLSMILVLVMLLSLLSMAAFTLPTAASSDGAASNVDFMRIFHLDCGRKYFTKDWIIALLNEMKADGYNQLQLAFGNDGLRFLLDDMSFTANGTNYLHRDVVSKVEAGNRAQNDSGDERWLTQSEMDDIISAAKALGIEIVPLLNLPGHANAILDIVNDAYNASGSNNTLDVANSEAARSFGMAIFQKYVDYFASKGCKFFSFGADEYANDAKGTFSFSRLNSTQYSSFVSFINSLSSYIDSKGMTPRAFNDGLYYNNQSANIDNKIQCCYWSGGWSGYDVATPSVISSNGHAMINTHGDYYYVLGKADKFDSGYSYASSFDNTVFASKYGNKISNPVGSMFCIWCDYPNAENEQTVAQKVRLPMRAMALRMENQSIANMDESVVTKGFNANGSLNAGSTVTPDTSTSTKDIYVAVNGTATETVSGTYSGPYTTGDTSIATVTTNTTTTERKLKAVTSIESDHQYLIVNNEAKKALTDTAASTTYRPPYAMWMKYNVSGLSLSGDVSAENTTDLWTIESVGTKYKIKNASGQYLTFGDYTASVGTTDTELTFNYNNSGYWTIQNGESYLSRYDNTPNNVSAGYSSYVSDDSNKWTIYEITGGETTTTLTFSGVAVGTTSVKIGDVTYTIHVTKELPANALTADTITLEHWITNAKVTSESGGSNNLQTISREYTGVQTEDGVAVDSLAYTPVGYWEATQVYFWKGVRLDSEHKQTNENGVDRTAEGTDITHIRYLDGAWQYKTADDAWHYFVNTDQLVAYYLQKTTVTKEVETYVKDWGFGTSGTTDNNDEGQVALTVAVVYPDGTVSPAEGNMYANSTTIFNYWNNRDIGIIAPKNNSDYNISKITVTDGARKENTSANQWYNSDTITWDKKTTAAGRQWYDETKVWDKSDGTTPMVNGKTSNITWSAKNTAKLVLIYLEPVVKETNLNIVYWDDTANKQINPNTIQISMAYNQGGTEPTYFTALCDANGNVIGDKGPWNSNANYLPDDAYVVNSSNVKQTISKDMTQIEGIAGNYTSGLYEYRSADISTDGKTLTLHYGLKNTGTKTYVVDFGLPVTIPLSDLGITDLNTISWISLKQEDKECLKDHGTYGTAVIDKVNKTVTYTLDQTLDNEIAIPINIKFTNSNEIKSFSFHVIPATSVYYEDSFASFTNGTGNASEAKWSIVDNNGNVTADQSASQNQTLTELGKMSADAVYGHDAAYADSTKLSMGSAHKVTVSKDMYVKGDTTTTWPSATFTFKGTGFDVISLTSNTSGSVVYTVTGKNTGKTETHLVDTYYGYKLVDNKWVVDKNSNSTLYQIPVIKVTGLPYDEYTVTLSVRYGEFFDHQDKGNYSFWLDAVRVYDPMGKDNATYTQDDEGYPQYIKLRDALVTENVRTTLFIDGAAEANITAYKNYGPNNEVYLSNGQAITFTVPKNAKIASIQIGAKAPDGSAAKMNVNGTETNISSATEMYYEIGTEGQNFTIANKGNGILSLTNLKITFKEKPDSTIALTPLSTEEQNAAVMSVRALFAAPEQTFEPEHFTAKWSRNVRKGGTATLTVKASADVEAITVNGEKITAYTTKTTRSFWGSKETYHVFTYRETNAATANYTVCALNAGGAVSDPIIATLTVRPSIRDWWNGIFDKWKH